MRQIRFRGYPSYPLPIFHPTQRLWPCARTAQPQGKNSEKRQMNYRCMAIIIQNVNVTGGLSASDSADFPSTLYAVHIYLITNVGFLGILKRFFQVLKYFYFCKGFSSVFVLLCTKKTGQNYDHEKHPIRHSPVDIVFCKLQQHSENSIKVYNL